MSLQLPPDDGDLAFYAMRQLPPADADAMQRHLASNPADRARLAMVEVALGLFAEETVSMQQVPEGSLERLMQNVVPGRQEAVKLLPTGKPLNTQRPWSIFRLLPWAGWAVAAASVLLVAGRYIPREAQLASQVANANAAARQAAAAKQQAETQNRLLQTALQQRTVETIAHQNRVSNVEQQAAALKAKADAALTTAARQEAKANDLTAVAAAATRERDSLRGQLDAQAAESSQIAARSTDAEELLSALRNPAALRVTLTVPKKKPSPTGRGTYLASTGSLIFIGSNLPTLQANKVYELWLMPSDGSAPLPAGTFLPDATGSATLVASRFRQNVAAKGFAVTVENQGGSQTPTLPIVLAGA